MTFISFVRVQVWIVGSVWKSATGFKDLKQPGKGNTQQENVLLQLRHMDEAHSRILDPISMPRAVYLASHGTEGTVGEVSTKVTLTDPTDEMRGL